MGFYRSKVPVASIPETLRSKLPLDLLEEGDTPISKRLIRSFPHVFVGKNCLAKLAVVLALVDYKRPEMPRWPTLEFLAFVAGMPREEFKSRLDELVEDQLLTFKLTGQ